MVVGPLDFLYRLLGGRIVVFVLGDIRNASIERFSVILRWDYGRISYSSDGNSNYAGCSECALGSGSDVATI